MSSDNIPESSFLSTLRAIIFFIVIPYIIFNVFDLKYYRFDSNETGLEIYKIDAQSLKVGNDYFDVELIIQDKKKRWLYSISNTTLQYEQEENLIIINACDENHRFKKIGSILGGCWTHNIIKLKTTKIESALRGFNENSFPKNLGIEKYASNKKTGGKKNVSFPDL